MTIPSLKNCFGRIEYVHILVCLEHRLHLNPCCDLSSHPASMCLWCLSLKGKMMLRIAYCVLCKGDFPSSGFICHDHLLVGLLLTQTFQVSEMISFSRMPSLTTTHPPSWILLYDLIALNVALVVLFSVCNSILCTVISLLSAFLTRLGQASDCSSLYVQCVCLGHNKCSIYVTRVDVGNYNLCLGLHDE